MDILEQCLGQLTGNVGQALMILEGGTVGERLEWFESQLDHLAIIVACLCHHICLPEAGGDGDHDMDLDMAPPVVPPAPVSGDSIEQIPPITTIPPASTTQEQSQMDLPPLDLMENPPAGPPSAVPPVPAVNLTPPTPQNSQDATKTTPLVVPIAGKVEFTQHLKETHQF